MKKLICLLLILFICLPVFSQTYEELKAQLETAKQLLADTTVMVTAVIKEKDDLIEKLNLDIKDKQAKIDKLNDTVKTMKEENDKTIDKLNKQISDDSLEIIDLRGTITILTGNLSYMSLRSSILFSVGYTTQGNYLVGSDFIFSIWKLKFITGVQYITPLEFGLKAGVGFSF